VIGLLALAGCPVGADDQVDRDGGGDGSSGGAGLTVTWSVRPDVPGTISSPVGVDALEVDEVRFELSSLRAIGDSAPPGDPRTSTGSLNLRWRSDEAPADVEMPAAPAGLYSRLELGSGGSDEHLVIKGDVTIGGVDRDFEIQDERQHPITILLSLTLAPGQRAAIPVDIDVAAILASVPFDQLEDDDGTLVFPENDPRLDAVWAAIDGAFSVPTTFVIDGR
jgi:hypothetical protein